MIDRVRTLLLFANGTGNYAILKDTLCQGVLGLPPDYRLPEPLRHIRFLDWIVSQRNRYENLSYIDDWLDVFHKSSRLEINACNINNIVDYRRYKRALLEYPLVVVMHSATGDNMNILLKTESWFKCRRGKLIVFVGNEYSLMPEKLRFIRNVEADYICTQLPRTAADWLYSECVSSHVLYTPHALNPSIYFPQRPNSQRPIDIGFVGSHYPHFIGDMERSSLLNYFEKNCSALGLKCSINTRKVPRENWAVLLNSFKAIAGGEAGTYFLEKTGETIRAVTLFMRKHPNAPFEEVFERFFRKHPITVSGKAISSRHFEPIGTKTCQILVEGHYNGILSSGKHYISVKKDLSNIREAVELFHDEQYRSALISDAFDYIMAEHTYQKRLDYILENLGI